MMPKEDIVYIAVGIFAGLFSALTTMALKLHIRTFNLCCNVIQFTRSVSSQFIYPSSKTASPNSTPMEEPSFGIPHRASV